MLMQNFGGQTKSIRVFLKEAYETADKYINHEFPDKMVAIKLD